MADTLVEKIAAAVGEKYAPAVDQRAPYAKIMVREAAKAAFAIMQAYPRNSHGAPLDEHGVRFQNAALADENKQLRQALNEVVTNGEWTEGEQCGDWKISKEVYETARDALAGAEDHPVAGWPA